MPAQGSLPPAEEIEIGGIAVALRDGGGTGVPVLCIHESAAAGVIWEPLADEMSSWARPIAYDRRGWGGSAAPQGYRGTTVAEHSEDAVEVLAALGLREAIVCG